jgi:hypothetical protein
VAAAVHWAVFGVGCCNTWQQQPEAIRDFSYLYIYLFTSAQLEAGVDDWLAL